MRFPYTSLTQSSRLRNGWLRRDVDFALSTFNNWLWGKSLTLDLCPADHRPNALFFLPSGDFRAMATVLMRFMSHWIYEAGDYCTDNLHLSFN